MIALYKPPHPATLAEDLHSCLKSGWWGYGPACRSLEEKFTSRGGWALSTSSCTAALYLAARALLRSPEDEVIVPAITFIATPMAFLSAGFTVKVADVEPETLMLTPQIIKPLITENTRAIVAVHLYGQQAPVRELRELCDGKDLFLIEDCAHRLDLDDPGPPAGDFACYSFNAVKEAPAGEGGLLWGRDASVEARVRAISNVGLNGDTWQRSSKLQHPDYQFCSEIGLKLRLNDIAGTIVNVMITNRHAWRDQRKTIFDRYDRILSQSASRVKVLHRNPADSYLMYVVRVEAGFRSELRRRLAAAGIATSTHYPSLSRHPLLKQNSCDCVVAESIEKEVLTLPCFPDLNLADQNQVISTMIQALDQAH